MDTKLRTSTRRAWGSSLRSSDAIMEWELGSRVMNDTEVENHRFTKLGAVTARIERAGPVSNPDEADADELIECVISVSTPGLEEKLFYVYDALDDDRLLAQEIHPKPGTETTVFAIEEVADWCPWADYETPKG